MKKIFTLLAFAISVTAFSQPKYCDISFSYSHLSTQNIIRFNANILDSTRIISWHWDFGDGAISNISNPKHDYNQQGTYVACVTINTDDGCENTFCDTIKIGPTLNYYVISGYVYAGNALLPEGVALLINANNYKAKQFAHVINGHYEFGQVLQGNYMVYIIPNFNLDVNYYPTYLPTYYGHSEKWQNASIINVTNSVFNQNINLICNTDVLYGDNKISGKLNITDASSFEYNIYYNNWFGNVNTNINLEIAPNIPVLLLNNADQPIRFTTTDSIGSFNFENLPVNIYKIAPQKAGLITVPSVIDFTSTTDELINTNMIISANNIYNSINITETGISNFSIYPNPVTEGMLNIFNKNSNNFVADIYNANGQKIATSGNIKSLNYNFNLKNSTKGVYFIKIITQNNNPLISKFIIK